MQDEFLRLVQEDLTVDAYESRFLTRGRYDPDIVRDERCMTQRFMLGLRGSQLETT